MDNRVYSLRPLKPEDAPRMAQMMWDEQTTRYLQIGGPSYTLETALGFIAQTKDESKHLHRAVVDDNDTYYGSISLKNIDRENKEAEYAISMHPEAQGKGIAAIATAKILELAFQELGLSRVYLNVLVENQRANKFYQKVGFHYTHSSTILFKGEEKTLNWYAATNVTD